MHLCGALISQMEATQQSERKSMNKSLAFARASHDIRASLAGINVLIEICRIEVSKRDPLRSEIPANLLQMESCTRDLLGILNLILDTSKIEAGKMQLDEEEFDLEKLMEDVVDLYHPVGRKKGVDIILDPFDGSVTKFSRVRGDRGKLKQILSNLLSNAVKFTSNGHVVVRIQRAYSEPEATHRETNNRVEFVFEVNDTGKAILKEKQKLVFKNYVQVKETALGQEGTGLGLGIVHLMGWEIGIVDKEAGEKGTCFRFKAFFEKDNNSSPSADIESIGHDSFLIDSPERSTLLQGFMHKIGIKVHVVKQYEQLSPSLKRIKRKLNISYYSSSGKSTTSSARSKKEFPLSALEGTDDVLPNPRAGYSGFVLIVIDTSVAPFREISRTVAEFRRDLSENCCSKVVWLDSLQGLDEDKLPSLDLVISKPLHGSRLYWTIGILPEFGGLPPRKRVEASHSVENIRRGNDVASSDGGASKSFVKGSKCEIEEVGGANNKKKPLLGRKILVADDDPIGRKIATFVGVQLDSSIFPCENREEDWNLVCKSQTKESMLELRRLYSLSIMPVMNGVDATARIRKVEESYGVRIPIIALTAHKKGQEIDNMIQAGVDGYLTKPLNKDVVLKTISEIICNV
ncbi:PREDICTED: histidine kinase CKI1-like [Erythranthe guttata]|uniref:histidine kinase CKI1-like n=1 Tax=Erythranthe guttata TaxID=4155 RepID=UPI00064DDF64|nr:PREDICTED: histidine kinase CKI1-like [Erythranthe guttata]|eukprot:XP_012840505.1 PREDICTED: histidine kinase CKI1-like [Erythranthe guttata]